MKRKKKDRPTKEGLTKADVKRVCDILRRDDGVGAKDYIEQFSWLLFLKVFEGVERQLKELEEADGRKYKPVIDAEYQWSSWAKRDWKDKDELIHLINQKLFPYLKALKGDPKKDKIGEIFRELSGNRILSPHNLLDVIEILDKIEKHHFQDTNLLSQVYEEILQAMGSEGGWSGEFYTPRPIIRAMVKIVNPELGETIFDPFVGSGGFLVESFNHIYEKSAKDVRAWRTLQTKTFYGQEKKPLPFLIGTMNLILHHIFVPNLTRSNTFMEDVHNMPESSKMDVILTNPPFGAEETQAVQNNYPIQVAATEGLALQYVMKRLKNGGRCGIILPEGNILFGGGAIGRIREELLTKFNVHTIISLPQGAFSQMGTGIKTNLVFFDKTGPTKEIWYGEVSGKFTKKKTLQNEHFEDVLAKQKKHEVSDTSWLVPIEKIRERGYDLSARNPNGVDNDALLPPPEIISEIESNQRELDKIVVSMKELLHSMRGDPSLTRVPLSTFSTLQSGFAYKSTDYAEKGYSLMRIANVQSGYIDDTNRVYVPEEIALAKPQFILKEGDILVSLTGNVGRVGVIKDKHLPAILNQRVSKFVLNTEDVFPEYLFHILNSPAFEQACIANGKGAAQKNVSNEEVLAVEVPIPIKDGKPDLVTQKHIVKELDAVFALAAQLKTLAVKQEHLSSQLRVSSLNALVQPQETGVSTPVVSPIQPIEAPRMFDVQQAVAHILNRFERGEMVVAKVLYLGQTLFGVPTNIQFSAQNLGPYDTAVKKAVTAGLSPRNKFFAKKGSGSNQVLTLGPNASKILKYSTSALARKTNAYLDQMLPFFNQSDSASIERLATLCKIIEDERTTDEMVVKAKLQKWKPNKFTNEEVSRTIAFIKKQGWDQTLLK